MVQVLSLSQSGAQVSAVEKRQRFGDLARQHQAALLRIAQNYCKGNDALAQDLVQDTLVNGYRAYLDGAFHDGTNAKAWLARILTNLFLNDYRRRKRWEANKDLEDGAEVPGPVTAEPDRQLLEQILDGPIEEALGRLPDHQRMCVVLVDIEGLDYSDAAGILGCPVGTVRSRLARGRTALYNGLVEYGKERGIVK